MHQSKRPEGAKQKKVGHRPAREEMLHANTLKGCDKNNECRLEKYVLVDI